MRSRRRTFALLALLSLLPAAAGAAADPLVFDPALDTATLLLAGTAAGGLGLLAGSLTPETCRFCEPNAFDVGARRRLRWEDPARAAHASDLLANGLLPAAALGYSALMALGDGGAPRFGEDALVMGEAVLLSIDANQLVKSAAGRIRPSAWAVGRLQGTNSNRSFYSGHTAFAFSLAVSAGTLASMRGYRSAPWIWAVGMTLAAGVGYLRVAGDAHWTTDVLAGAALGGAFGLAVPWVLHRRRGGRKGGVQLALAPGGFALRW